MKVVLKTNRKDYEPFGFAVNMSGIRRKAVWYDVVWCGMVRCGVVWCGVWNDTVLGACRRECVAQLTWSDLDRT